MTASCTGGYKLLFEEDPETALPEFENSNINDIAEETDNTTTTIIENDSTNDSLLSDSDDINTIDTSDNTENADTTEDISFEWSTIAGLHDNISPDNQDAFNPKVVMDDNGNTIVVWRQFDGVKEQIFKSEYRDGAWTDPEDILDYINAGTESVLDYDVEMDNNGNAIIVWSQVTGPERQIFKSEYRNGLWTGLANRT